MPFKGSSSKFPQLPSSHPNKCPPAGTTRLDAHQTELPQPLVGGVANYVQFPEMEARQLAGWIFPAAEKHRESETSTTNNIHHPQHHLQLSSHNTASGGHKEVEEGPPPPPTFFNDLSLPPHVLGFVTTHPSDYFLLLRLSHNLKCGVSECHSRQVPDENKTLVGLGGALKAVDPNANSRLNPSHQRLKKQPTTVGSSVLDCDPQDLLHELRLRGTDRCTAFDIHNQQQQQEHNNNKLRDPAAISPPIPRSTPTASKRTLLLPQQITPRQQHPTATFITKDAPTHQHQPQQHFTPHHRLYQLPMLSSVPLEILALEMLGVWSTHQATKNQGGSEKTLSVTPKQTTKPCVDQQGGKKIATKEAPAHLQHILRQHTQRLHTGGRQEPDGLEESQLNGGANTPLFDKKRRIVAVTTALFIACKASTRRMRLEAILAEVEDEFMIRKEDILQCEEEFMDCLGFNVPPLPLWWKVSEMLACFGHSRSFVADATATNHAKRASVMNALDIDYGGGGEGHKRDASLLGAFRHDLRMVETSRPTTKKRLEVMRHEHDAPSHHLTVSSVTASASQNREEALHALRTRCLLLYTLDFLTSIAMRHVALPRLQDSTSATLNSAKLASQFASSPVFALVLPCIAGLIHPAHLHALLGLPPPSSTHSTPTMQPTCPTTSRKKEANATTINENIGSSSFTEPLAMLADGLCLGKKWEASKPAFLATSTTGNK